MASSKPRVDIPSKLIATIAIAFVLAWIVSADEKAAHVATVAMVCPNGTVQGIHGHKCYRYFSTGQVYDDAEEQCEESAEVKGSGQLALIESKAEKKLVKEIPKMLTVNPGRTWISRDSDASALGDVGKPKNEIAKDAVQPVRDELVDRVFIGGWNGDDKGIWSDGSSFDGYSNWAPDEPNNAHSKRVENNNAALFISPDPYTFQKVDRSCGEDKAGRCGMQASCAYRR